MLERYVLFFGDSHTLGVGDEKALGWVGRVAAAAMAAGVPLTPYNLGIRGQTSTEVVARFRLEAEPRMPEAGEAHAVFAVGANDVLDQPGSARLPIEASLRALEGLLDGARALGLRSFVVGPAPMDDEAENDRIEELTEAFRALCETRRVPFAALSASLRRSGCWRRAIGEGDGAHPGAAGYEEAAAIILANGWIEWLRR